MKITVEKKSDINKTVPFWLTCKWKLNHFYWEIRYFFNPCHKEIRKAISKRYKDLDGVIEDVVWAALKSWVEKEDGLFPQIKMMDEALDKYHNEPNDRKWLQDYGGEQEFFNYLKRYTIYKELQAAYQWITYARGLKIKEKQFDFVERRDDFYLDIVWHARKHLWT